MFEEVKGKALRGILSNVTFNNAQGNMTGILVSEDFCHGMEGRNPLTQGRSIYTSVIEHIDVVHVPGAFELPLAAKKLAIKGGLDAMVALSAVVRGATPHFEFVSSAATSGISSVARRSSRGRARARSAATASQQSGADEFVSRQLSAHPIERELGREGAVARPVEREHEGFHVCFVFSAIGQRDIHQPYGLFVAAAAPGCCASSTTVSDRF